MNKQEQSSKKPRSRRAAQPAAVPEAPASVPVEQAKPEIAPVVEPRRLMLTREEMLLMRAAQADLRAASAEGESARMTKLYVLAKLDPKGLVAKQEKTIAERESEMRLAREKFAAVRMKISTRLGINIERCGIDMETGEVVPQPA